MRVSNSLIHFCPEIRIPSNFLRKRSSSSTRIPMGTKVSIFRCGSRLNIVSPTRLARCHRHRSPQAQSHRLSRQLYTPPGQFDFFMNLPLLRFTMSWRIPSLSFSTTFYAVRFTCQSKSASVIVMFTLIVSRSRSLYVTQ